MKNNTGIVKSLLNQALHNTPDDFSLQEAKAYIRKALSIVENVENKRSVREDNKIARKTAVNSITATDFNSVLNVVENEIKKEKDRLQQLKEKKNAPKINDQDDQNGLDYVMG